MNDEIKNADVRVEIRSGSPTISVQAVADRPPPPDQRWRYWDLLRALKITYWSLKIGCVLGQLLGFRERVPEPKVT